MTAATPMDEFDEFDEDDDNLDQLIATSGVFIDNNRTQVTHGQGVRGQSQGHRVNTSSQNTQQGPVPGMPLAAAARQGTVVNGNNDMQLLSIQGENAILRSRLEALEKQRQQDMTVIRDQYKVELNDKLNKIQQFQELTVKLEDEKKFLKTELTSLSAKYKPANKKRKLDEEVTQSRNHQHNHNHNHQTSSSGNTSIVSPIGSTGISTVTPTSSAGPGAGAGAVAAAIATPIMPITIPTTNEKQNFIDIIYSHVINGAYDTTLHYLSKISSPINFKHENFHVIAHNGNITDSILKYLIELNNSIRLDNLISEFVEILTIYIQKLYLMDISNDGSNSNSNGSSSSCMLPVPFLLTLIHCSLSYRPSALNAELIEQLIIFNSDFLKNYSNILKTTNNLHSAIITNTTANGNGNTTDNEKKLQLQVLDQFVVIFAMDVVELLARLNFNRAPVPQSPQQQYLPDSSIIIKSCLSNGSAINFVFNAVQILKFTSSSQQQQKNNNNGNTDEFESYIIMMTKLLIDGGGNTPLLKSFRIYGLNRILGNNDDLKILLTKLVSSSSSSGQGPGRGPGGGKAAVQDRPNPILEADFEPIGLKNELKHELHRLNLHLQILETIETAMSTNNNRNGTDNGKQRVEFLVEILSILVWVLLKQQEFVMRNARSETIYLRNLIMSRIVRLIHYIILRNGTIPQEQLLQRISNTVAYNFIIAFVRISFASDTQDEVVMFVQQKLGDNFKVPIFNKHVEMIQYKQDNISLLINDGSADLKKQCILNANNGVEIKFDDDIIEMSRDLIELYTTAIEADSLFWAMNKYSESNKLDEMINEYLNE